MRRSGSLAVVVLAVVVLVGCGSSGPKRTVDARAEALRFFPADAPLVALLDTGPSLASARAALGGAVAGVPAWEAIRADALARLGSAGVPLTGLEALLAVPADEPAEGLPASQLAVGLGPGPGPTRSRTLVVLVTAQPERMERLFGHAAAGGELRRLGESDEAQIYSSADTAFAVRDGVMLAAESAAELRAAIALRDGNSDAQLDDSEVKTLLAKLPTDAPVEAYADLSLLRRRDPALAALAAEEPWARRLGKSAASLAARPAGTIIDLFSEIGPAPAGDSVLPEAEGTARYAVPTTEIRRAIGSGASPLGRLAIAAAPLAAAVAVTGDELRAKLVLSP